MGKFAVAAILVMALTLPIVAFSLLWSTFHLNVLIAAAIAVAVGWALNVAWAFATQRAIATEPSQVRGNTLAIAAYFGWACPAVLVLIAWIVWRLLVRGAV